VRRSKLSPKNCAIERAGNDVATSLPPVHGRNNVVAIAAPEGRSVKERLRGAGPSNSTLIAQIASELTWERAAPCSAEFVARVARPPRGRLNTLIFETLEAELGLPRNQLESALFPRQSRA